MASLNWKEHPQPGSQAHSQGAADPWFGIAMGLLGIVVGFILGIILR